MRLILAITIIVLSSFSLVFAADDVRIRDNTTSGYRADVDKLGTKYGLASTELPATSIEHNKVTTNYYVSSTS